MTYSQNIIRVTKSRKIEREEKVASKSEYRNEYRNLLGKT